MLREQAHQYKEMYAEGRNNTLANSFVRVFIKYILPSIMMMLLVSFVFFKPAAIAAPQGFSGDSLQRSAPQGFGLESTTPNTVKGVLENGRTDDYVVLEGRFITDTEHKYKDNLPHFLFTDANGDSIMVDISKSNNADAPMANVKYYIWGTIKQSLFSTHVKVIEYTPII